MTETGFCNKQYLSTSSTWCDTDLRTHSWIIFSSVLKMIQELDFVFYELH